MHNKEKHKMIGFTLMELISILVVLSIILAIAVPTITGIIKSSTRSAFESDAKLFLKAINYKKLTNTDFDPTILDVNNIDEELGLSPANYSSVNIAIVDNEEVISIIGEGKWEGFIACGTFRNMKVVENASECEGDTIPPVLTLLGDNPVTMYVGEDYVDPGATAFDNLSGDITDKIVVTGTVNLNVPGTYIISYTVNDLFENVTTVTRTINVLDIEAPMITFNPNGNPTYAKERTTAITVTDLGVIDNNSLRYIWTISPTEPSPDLFTSSFINEGTIYSPVGITGSYYLWAMASDSEGNKTVISSNIFNLDNTKPVITLNGESNITINKGSTYSDAGATATDDHSGLASDVVVTGSVNPNVVGTYTITYNVSDKAGNAADPVTRTVNVIDVLAPVITIKGDNPATIYIGTTYSDAGATAL
ncbi:MAG TPA: DUF5011 domain-containing protein, partial [Mollicutes bacterium]|nr:DUF5011 domain-containing protein [Mollicutes bacterium]